MSAEKIPCSVLILTLNCAESLARCVENLGSFGEVLVHDGNSEDNTVEVAQKTGCKVLKQYDTDERSVRVKDFTEIRLKQRADAAYDWVLYLDADEYMSDELVREVADKLPTADPKTIFKFPRCPIINGRLRTKGMFFPEIMPRIHHRKSGATLKKGKTVHEKYEYDSSFTEIVMEHPLYVPIDPLKDLKRKDAFYIKLEIDKKRREGYRWGLYCKWILFREPLIMASLAVRVLLRTPLRFSPDAVPFGYEWRHVTYHWKLFWAITRYMMFG